MKENIQRFLRNIFSITLMIAIFGGGVIFIMFVVSLIIGGTSGESLALSAANYIMPVFIRLASIAVLSGLVWIYLKGRHSLSMEDGD